MATLADTAQAPAQVGAGAGSESFFYRYLDPADRLNEILFGLIMVLTFTLTAGIAVGDSEEAGRELLIATFGCNLAWGIIDGAMYLTASLLARSRRTRAIAKVRAAPDEASAFAIIDREVEGTLASLASEEERVALYRAIHQIARHAPPERVRVRVHMEDVWGAVASGLLVVLTTVPAAIPFLVIDEPHIALRVSNALLVALLFVIGYRWGRYAHVGRWRAGLVFLAAGSALVAIAIALGG
jgi:hypothetical protein